MGLTLKLIDTPPEYDSRRDCLRIVASASVPDSDNEVVDPSTLRLDAYRLNPVVIWHHDQSSFPIAKCEDQAGQFTCRVERSGDTTQLVQDWYFAPTEEAQKAKALYRGRFLRGASIGFLADGYKRIPAADAASRWGVNKDLRLITGGELRETSAVPVPACPRALALGWLDETQLGAVMRSAPPLLTKSLSLFVGQAIKRTKMTTKTTPGAVVSQETETTETVTKAMETTDDTAGGSTVDSDEIKAAFHNAAVKSVGDLFDASHDDGDTHKACMKAIKVSHKGYVSHCKAMAGPDDSDDADDSDSTDDDTTTDDSDEKAVDELLTKVASFEEKAAKVADLETRVAALEGKNAELVAANETLAATLTTVTADIEADRLSLAEVLSAK